MASKKAPLRIALTTGDIDGIGPEVTYKSLLKLGPQKNVQFILFRGLNWPKKDLATLYKKFRPVTTHSVAEALWQDHPTGLIEVVGNDSPANWVELSANLCMQKQIHGMVTAPLSKLTIREAGLKDIGHTEILARLSGQQNLFMGFIGSKFSVVLATAHIPLAQVPQVLNANLLKSAVLAADKMRGLLPKIEARKPIALVGLNPHAGEHGILGSQETWFRQVITSYPAGQLVGPLVPDAAFLPTQWRQYSVYVCPYHDQGLIPFKMAHGFDEGVHLTLGLPFVRTSVDHGTAKELRGKNKAQFGSMLKAIQWAVRLAKEKQT